MTCTVDDCGRDVERAGLCATHRKRKQRGRPLSPPVRQYDPRETLELASRAMADADTSEDSDADFERARKRLEMAALRFALRKRPRPHCPRPR